MDTAALQDLTAVWRDLKAHVDALARERQHYLDFFENALHASIVTDAAGTILESNGGASDLLHRRRQHLRGKPLAAFVALDMRAKFRSWLSGLAPHGAVASFATTLECGGERLPVELSVRGIEGATSERESARLCWRLRELA